VLQPYHLRKIGDFRLRFLGQPKQTQSPIGVANRERAAGIGVAVGGALFEA
jgi:hypothetical protein